VVNDITDPVVIATIVQTIVITLTLIIFIMSFRSQNKSIQEQAYQKLLDDYNDAMKTMMERPELYQLWVDLQRVRPIGDKIQTRDDMVVRNFVIMLYGLFERLHFLYRRKWIDKETWDQWAVFLETIADLPVFKDVHEATAGMYDKPFQEHVSGILRRRKKD
jgi:hypothetical protein